jgi:uncharacterized LabA/DUF88 family protein
MDQKERVSVYIDGFNLYFGLAESFPSLKWLNVELLAQNLLKPHQELVAVNYFTSLVGNNPPKEKRQRDYLSALKTTGIQIIYGHYKSKMKSCFSCRHTWHDNEEKMTDVNIAVQMLMDALDDRYDTAMLISGDSDLVPPIRAVHSRYPKKRVMVAFPPNRHNVSIKNESKGNFIIGRQKLKQSQFPDSLLLSSGFQLQKPNEWQ